MRRNPPTESIQGVPAARLANGFVLVRTRAPKPAATPAAESARVLLAKVGRALDRPGLPRPSVFTGALGIYAYSVDPSDATRLLREAPDGSLTVGTMVEGQFIELCCGATPAEEAG